MKLIFSNGIAWNFKLIWQGVAKKLIFIEAYLATQFLPKNPYFCQQKKVWLVSQVCCISLIFIVSVYSINSLPSKHIFTQIYLLYKKICKWYDFICNISAFIYYPIMPQQNSSIDFSHLLGKIVKMNKI